MDGWAAELPTFALRRTRALARSSELMLTLLACGVGVAGGVLAWAMGAAARALQALAYGLGGGRPLTGLDPETLLTRLWVLPVGGAALALIALWWAQRGRGVPVDPVEANALRGGRMSVRDSLVVGGQVLVTGAAGAPLGLEVGTSQVASALASRVGQALRLKRYDLRDSVGAAAAATMAATFGSPLVGAFFAFEVVVGAYSLGNVAPVIAAAVVAVLTARALGAGELPFRVEDVTVAASDYPALMILALACAGVGVLLMQATAWSGRALERSPLPRPLRPVLGGLAIAGLALLAPAALGSGATALGGLFAPAAWTALLVLAAVKFAASALAIGAGFRGGLFSPSLLIGGALGKLSVIALLAVAPALAPSAEVAVLVGMAALGAAVIGAPLCLAFLVLSVTGDVAAGAAALAGAVLANLIVRETFGYSFSTWRLHLRGERVRGAHDVGLLRELTVERIMKRAPRTFRADAPLSSFCADWPLGGRKTVVAVDAQGRYAGMLWVDDCHALEERAGGGGQPVAAAADAAAPPLTLDTPVQQALRVFDRSGAPALAVVRSADDPVVVGVLGEAYATRRLAEALDATRKGVVGY